MYGILSFIALEEPCPLNETSIASDVMIGTDVLAATRTGKGVSLIYFHYKCIIVNRPRTNI